MKFNSIRCAVLLGLVFGSAISGFSQSGGRPVARYTAKTLNTSSPGDTVRVDILRWSTDTDRDQLFMALESNGATAVPALLQKAPTMGYIWTTESAGYPLRYAYRVSLADGGERVVLAIDRPLGSYEPQRWKLMGNATSSEYPFTIVEIRFTKAGSGEGKSSLNAKVVADKTAKTIALDNYAAIPVLFQDVKK